MHSVSACLRITVGGWGDILAMNNMNNITLSLASKVIDISSSAFEDTNPTKLESVCFLYLSDV